MKKFLMVMLAVVFFSGCSSTNELTGEEWLATDPTWGQYSSYSHIAYTSNAPIEDIIDLGDNVVGISRDKIGSVNIADISVSLFGFMTVDKKFYYSVEEGSGIATDTLVKHLEFSDADPDGLSKPGFEIDLALLFAEAGNENVTFGDEICKINIYSDRECTKLYETFSFIL